MNKKISTSVLMALLVSGGVTAQTANDTVATQKLKEVVVEARLQSTSATVSTYIPTKRQRNAAQNGPELLNHMAIPQLGLVSGNNVTTNSGQKVDLYIDYVPASEQDLNGMRMADVKKVEYYDFPTDPRFQGSQHVINFIMQKYEYGGYVKAYANEFFIANSGQLNLFSKLQYKRMTFDIGVGTWYSANDHLSQSTVETYRLPQADGSIKIFERISEPDYAKVRQQSYWPTFKAAYLTDKITMVNTLGANFFRSPEQNTAGSVRFSPADFPTTEYTDDQNSRTNSITYSGFWNFILPHGNSLSFNPYYSYSHTNQHRLYSEAAGTAFANGATDDSHRATASLRFVHDFGKYGNITAILNGTLLSNRTLYSGTSTSTDRLTTYRVGPGVMYNFKNNKFNGLLGGGFNYDHSTLGSESEHSTQPWMDLSLQYGFNSKNSMSLDLHHATWTLASSYRSTAVIQSNPLFSYTGNPDINPYKRWDASLRYVFIPNNKFNLAVFGQTTVITDRYAYVYEASPNGILRTIQQKGVGDYSSWLYGVQGTARLFNNSLMINGQVAHSIVRNGVPFDWTKQRVLWYLQAFYYVGGWNFGLQYQSPQEYCDGFVNGAWMKDKSAYTAIAGWGNSTWSVQARLTNPFRWNWEASKSETTSPNYDVATTYFNTSYHCYVLLSATYTFGFGKKIQRGNEASQQMGTSSSILQ